MTPVHFAAAAALLLTAAAQLAEDRIVNDLFDTAPKGAALQAAIAQAAGSPLGSQANPVRVTMPAGERAYLSHLRCSDGKAPEFGRVGSTGIGPYGMILDLFELRCAYGQPASAKVYMDMYHSYNETAAVPGFTAGSVPATSRS